MRKGLIAGAALLVGATVAFGLGSGGEAGGGSRLIRNDGGKGRLPRAVVQKDVGSGPVVPGRDTPSLYLAGGRPLATLASLDLGGAVPALRAAAGDGATLVFHPDRGHVLRARRLVMPPPVADAPRESALELLRAHAAAFGLPREPEDSWIRDPVEGTAGTMHFAVEQHADDGIPIYGAIVTVHTDALGAPISVESEAEPEPRTIAPLRQIRSDEALFRAGGPVSPLEGGGRTGVRLVYFRPGAAGDYRLTYQVDAGPIRTFVDAESGLIMDRVDRRCYADADANVYDPNIGQAGDVTNTKVRTLTDLDTTGFPQGTIVRISDKQNLLAFRPARDANGVVLSQDYTAYEALASPPDNREQVEQLSVYHYVVQTSKKVESLASGAINFGELSRFYPLGAVLDIDDDANAFYDPSDRSLKIGQGNSSKGIDNLQRDIDVVAHEFGHFVETTLAPDETPRLNSPRRAMGEGFGDFTAAAVNVTAGAAFRGGTLASASCIADSTIPDGGGFTCLREINPPVLKKSPQDIRGEEHDDGEIIAGALWSLAEKIAGGDATPASINTGFQVYLAGLPFLPRSNAQFSDLVDALVSGDQARTGGTNVTAITKAFQDHGILGTKPPPSGVTTTGKPKEILLGVPVDISVPASTVARFFVAVPTATTTVLEVVTAATGGDLDLFVAPNNYTVSADVLKDDTLGDSNESVTVDDTTTPKITRDSFWLIDVKNSSTTEAATGTLTATDTGTTKQPENLGTFAGTTTGTKNGATLASTPVPAINPASEVDLYYFNATENQIVGVSVTPGVFPLPPKPLEPAVWLFDPDLNVLASDTDGLPEPSSATITGAFIPKSGRYVIAVTARSTEPGGPQTTGPYNLTVFEGDLPGTEIQAGVVASGTITDGESQTFHIKLSTGDTRLEFFLRSKNVTNTGDIDLYVTHAGSTSETFEFFSIGAEDDEHVDVHDGTSPPLSRSRVWFAVVTGADVKSLAGQSQEFELEAVVNQPFPRRRSGGGGCGLAAGAGAAGAAGLWLPLALMAAGVAVTLRLRRRGAE